MADFTTYWLPEQIRDNQGTRLNHAADNNFHDVAPGDTVWIVTARKGQLFLFGRIRVTRALDQAGAERLLSQQLWKAEHHVYCPESAAEAARLVPLGRNAWQLTFISDTSPQLTPRAGKIDAQQVRRVRRLTPAAAAILNHIWESQTELHTEAMPASERRSFPDVDDGLLAVGREGKQQWYKHLRRERDSALVKLKKRHAKAKTGRLRCEACKFDFEAVFGAALADFCEVHHRVPLSHDVGERETHLDDLAVLCANCHRAIHRLGPEMPSVPELAQMIRQHRRNNSVL
jgi:hypothetical protein